MAALRRKYPNAEFFVVRIFLYSVRKQNRPEKLRIWILFTQCRYRGNLTTSMSRMKRLLVIILSESTFFLSELHCVKIVRIRSYSGPQILQEYRKYPRISVPQIIDRYSVSLRIQSEYGKIWTRIIPNVDTFYAVIPITR